MAVGDIIYVKSALGKEGKRIKVFKLRTMHPDAEQRYYELKKSNGVDNLGKIVKDPRIIKGRERWRELWIDELPKLFNLLRGDISFVGICARGEAEWEHLPLEHKQMALQYRPGLFPVHYSGNTRSYQEMIELERRYLQEKQVHPLLTDIKYFARIMANIIDGVRSR